jgi:AAT family amino acid transporter/D-serine/D-alanine/glycine transporter
MGMGSAIGAGFFLSSGSAIHQSGPGLLLAYLFAGTVVYLVMRALGELALAYPSAGSFTTYTAMFQGPLAGFIMGWSYWLGTLLVSIAEVTAVGILLRPWFPGIPQWVPALCAVVVLYVINIQTVRSFGEMEYWIAMIKVATLFGVLLCGLNILLFRIGDLGRQASISNLWTYGGFLPNGFSGVLAALPTVLFAFGGVEVIGLAAAETERPEHTLPRAIRGIIYRIIFIYVGSLAIFMTLYPWDRFEPTKSPFVTVLQHAGLSAAAGVVTFVAITALLSSCNCSLFASSRILRSLACSGQAPLRLQSLSRQGIPHFSVSLSGIAMLIGVGLNYVMPERLFGYLLTMVAWLLLLVWANITLTHLLYRRAVSRGQARRVSFRMPGAPYTSCLVLLAIGVVAVMLTIHESSTITLYLVLSWFGVLVIAYFVTASRHSTGKGRN